MTIQLEKFEDAAKLYVQTGWICCACRTVNSANSPECQSCGKPHWYQLGIRAHGSNGDHNAQR